MFRIKNLKIFNKSKIKQTELNKLYIQQMGFGNMMEIEKHRREVLGEEPKIEKTKNRK